MTLYSIAPHARFLATLADRVFDGTLLGDWDRSGPFWLSDVTVVVPTRRAKLALAEVFAQRGTGLLPDIRTFGGEVADEEPFLPPFDLPLLPGLASVLERRLVLSWLVAAWARTARGREAFANPPNAAEILSMAEALGTLLDRFDHPGGGRARPAHDRARRSGGELAADAGISQDRAGLLARAPAHPQ